MNLELIQNLSDDTLKVYLAESYAVLSAKITGKVNSSKLTSLSYEDLQHLSGALEAETRNRKGQPTTSVVAQKIETEISHPFVVQMKSEPKPEPKEAETDLIGGKWRKFDKQGKLNPKPIRYVYSIIRDGHEFAPITTSEAKKVVKMVVGESEWIRRNFDIYGYTPLKTQARQYGSATVKLSLKGKPFVLKAVPKKD
jgi:hypothetical protein